MPPYFGLSRYGTEFETLNLVQLKDFIIYTKTQNISLGLNFNIEARFLHLGPLRDGI
jgi:hypothetical protein